MFALLLSTAVAGAPPTPMRPEPPYLTDVEALRSLPARLHEACAWTGRIRYLHISDVPTVVVLAEVEGGELDSVVFSYGAVIRKPVAMDDEERRRLQDEVFPLRLADLMAIPGAVEATIQANPFETTIESVELLGIGGPPHRVITPAHPRRALEPVQTPLPGGREGR